MKLHLTLEDEEGKILQQYQAEVNNLDVFVGVINTIIKTSAKPIPFELADQMVCTLRELKIFSEEKAMTSPEIAKAIVRDPQKLEAARRKYGDNDYMGKMSQGLISSGIKLVNEEEIKMVEDSKHRRRYYAVAKEH
jgi:hypothetical protein